jgi:hypothetical protein
LDFPKVGIVGEDIPLDALSFLESDAEDLSQQENLGVRRRQDSMRLQAIGRYGRTYRPTTPHYQGPLTSRKPGSMKSVQEWMVDQTILQEDVATCKENRDPPFTPETVLTLKRLFNTALEIRSFAMLQLLA